MHCILVFVAYRRHERNMLLNTRDLVNQYFRGLGPLALEHFISHDNKTCTHIEFRNNGILCTIFY